MLYQVISIEFDFDEPVNEAYINQLVNETLAEPWEADDEDDLVDHITWSSGWAVKSLDYVPVK